MSQLSNWISNVTSSQLFPLGVVLAVAAFTVVGLALIMGTRKMLEWGKEHVIWIIAGLILIYTASSLVTSITSQF